MLVHSRSGSEPMIEKPIREEFANAVAEARTVLTYMRAVANKDRACLGDSQKSIRESLALLKRLPDGR
jgi:hypothetical protein